MTYHNGIIPGSEVISLRFVLIAGVFEKFINLSLDDLGKKQLHMHWQNYQFLFVTVETDLLF